VVVSWLLVAATSLDGVDYPPDPVFNQTKWNDALYQKN